MDVIAFGPQRQIGINFEAPFKKPQKFCEGIYARVAEPSWGAPKGRNLQKFDYVLTSNPLDKFAR
jgi:hypothetical protein